MRHLRTLRARFALWTAGLLLAALVLFGLLIYANMSYSLTRAIDETLRSTSSQLLIEVRVADGQLRFAESPVEETEYAMLRDQGFSFQLWDLAGRPLQSDGRYRSLPRPPGDLRALSSAGELATLSDPVSHETLRLYSRPALVDGEELGVLQVALSLSGVQGTLNLLLFALLLSGPLIVVAAAASGYALAARALSPIDEITRTARQISASDLSARLDLASTDDEVGRLAATFDSMLARLEDAFRRERQFTAAASHELRTPLAAMQTIIGSTLARRRSAAEYEQALADLEHESAQLRTMTEGLLQLARSDRAPAAVRDEPVDLALLLKDVIESLRPLAEERGLALVDCVPDAGLTTLGDSDGLIRLFVNLLDNAIKYTERGTITVSASRCDAMLVASVSDTGVGIRPEQLPLIFDRFYRADAARSRDGVGLGLSIAQSIAQAHGGTIEVASIAGRHTTFTVRLPQSASALPTA